MTAKERLGKILSSTKKTLQQAKDEAAAEGKNAVEGVWNSHKTIPAVGSVPMAKMSLRDKIMAAAETGGQDVMEPGVAPTNLPVAATEKEWSLKDLFAKGKGKGLGLAGGAIALQFMIQAMINQSHESTMTGIQAGGAREMAGMMTPENAYYKAMLPVSTGEKQLAQEALVSYLMGTTGPSLARGERRIGG